jgi:hypothetical protein
MDLRATVPSSAQNGFAAVRLRHLPDFRQTRRSPRFSGNADYRSSANKLNPLDFEARFIGPEVPAERVVEALKGRGLRRWLNGFVPPVGETFP